MCVWMADLEYLATGIRLVVDRRKPEANGPAIVNWNYNKFLKKKTARRELQTAKTATMVETRRGTPSRSVRR